MINGEKLRYLMDQKGIQGQELAASVGISKSMMSYIIQELRDTTVTVLVRITKVLGCTADELIAR